MNLISTTDFVLDEGYKTHRRFNPDCEINYAKFLKQPLEVGMFIPCDKEGNILKACGCFSDIGCCLKEHEYKQAKERVLFLGIEVHDVQPSVHWNYISLNGVKIAKQANDGKYYILGRYNNIESLYYKIESIKMTKSAIKQIGL